MANTSRLGLYKPIGTELCIIKTALNDALDIMDSKAFTVLISDTTPTAEFIGQEWWKNNTKEFFYWSGSDWVEVDLTTPGGGPSTPSSRKGFAVSSNVSNANSVTTAESTTAFIPVTFAATSGKKYEFTFCGNIAMGFNTGLNIQGMINLRITLGATVLNSGTLVHRVPVGRAVYGNTTSSKNSSFVAQWTAPSTANYTVGVFLRKISATDTISFKSTNYHALAVEEVG